MWHHCHTPGGLIQIGKSREQNVNEHRHCDHKKQKPETLHEHDNVFHDIVINCYQNGWDAETHCGSICPNRIRCTLGAERTRGYQKLGRVYGNMTVEWISRGYREQK